MIDREAIMLALLAQLSGPPCIVNFTADTILDSVNLANVSAGAQLFKGMPIFGPGISEGTVIATVSPPALSLPATANGTGIQLAQGFLTTGRRLLHWSQIAAQPALFIDDGDEEWPARSGGIPAKPILEAEIWIYSNGGKNPDATSATQMNALLSAVETALAPSIVFNGIDRQNVQTLGGAVEHCWIEGRMIKASGHLDGQSIAIVPVHMLVPE